MCWRIRHLKKTVMDKFYKTIKIYTNNNNKKLNKKYLERIY